MLSQRWTAYDVEDVEALGGRVLEHRLRRWGGVLNEQDNEDVLAFLLERSWELYVKYDPWFEATLKLSFSTFLYRRLRFCVVDWYRQRFEDRRHTERAGLPLARLRRPRRAQ